jgi:hypothetical protein
MKSTGPNESSFAQGNSAFHKPSRARKKNFIVLISRFLASFYVASTDCMKVTYKTSLGVRIFIDRLA